MVVDNFPWNKKNLAASKMESQFYDIFLGRMADAADRKLIEQFDETAKTMTLQFDRIPAAVLGVTKQQSTSCSNMVPMYREFIGQILALGIVNSDLLNKVYLKKDQHAAMGILFRVILVIFVRLDVLLRNSNGELSDEEFKSNIVSIAKEEWSPSSYEKMEKLLAELTECDELFEPHKQQESIKEETNARKVNTRDPSSSQKRRCSSDEILGAPEGSLADLKRKKGSMFTSSQLVLPKARPRKAKRMRMKLANGNGEFICKTPPPQLSPVVISPFQEDNTNNYHQLEMPTLVSVWSLGDQSSPAMPSSNVPDVPKPSTKSSRDIDERIKRDPSPEVEVVGQKHGGQNKSTDHGVKKSRWDDKSDEVSVEPKPIPVLGIQNNGRSSHSIIRETHCSLRSVQTRFSPTNRPTFAVPPIRSLGSTPPDVSSLPMNPSPPMFAQQPGFQSSAKIGLARHPASRSNGISRQEHTTQPGTPDRRKFIEVGPPVNFSQVLEPNRPSIQQTTSTIPNHVPQTNRNRLAEVETLLTVLKKFAWELESEVVESCDRMQNSLSFKCSIGNPQISLFVGYAVRQDEDLVEGRFWSLVHLYQSLQLVFPPFVLDDIRNSAISGLWPRVDQILHNSKQLFVFTVVKMREIALLSRLSNPSELPLLLQQRLLITQSIEATSRSFWSQIPPPTNGFLS